MSGISGIGPGRGPWTKCTANTDQVDGEIRRLKQQKETLERRMAQAEGDPAARERLQKRLSQIERELSAKDTDGYRRRNARFTSEEGEGQA